MEVEDLDVTAANNNQPPPNGAPENTMQFSDVNDVMREMMAMLARWFGDINGALSATGTGAALALTTNRTGLTLANGLYLSFTVASDSTSESAATLTVTPSGGSALTTKSLVDALGFNVQRRLIPSGATLSVAYNSTHDAFVVLGGMPGLLMHANTGTNLPLLSLDLASQDQHVSLGTGYNYINILSGSTTLLDRRHSGAMLHFNEDAFATTTVNLAADFTAEPGATLYVRLSLTSGITINFVPLGGGNTLSVTSGPGAGSARQLLNLGSGGSASLTWYWTHGEV